MNTPALGSANKNAVGGRSDKSVRAMNPDRAGARGKGGKGQRRTARGAGFAAFADEIRRKLDPRGHVEDLVVERVVDSAWRLRAASEAGHPDPEGDDPDRPAASASTRAKRNHSAADRALRSMKEALETLDTLQSFRPAAPEPAPAPAPAPDPAPMPAPADSPFADDFDPAIVAFDPFFDGDASDWTLDADAGDTTPSGVPIWKDRLVFDFEVSDFSPVVKGTWVTVSHVVSLIVDGFSWEEILRTHPELTSDDVHACMAYALDELNDPK